MKILLIILVLVFSTQASDIVVASKKFTENIILADIAGMLLKDKGFNVDHRAGLGGTRVLWNALLKSEIDLYPEYSGTISQEIFAAEKLFDFSEVLNKLDSLGIAVVGPLGFNNTYALGMLKNRSGELSISEISDLNKHPQLVLGFTNEFMDRADGWPALQRSYQLPQKNVQGLDHDLAYRGLASGALDVIDLYSTDAEILYYDLQVLKDNLNHFTEYQALYLVRKDLLQQDPAIGKTLHLLAGQINAAEMVKMNARAKIDKIPSMDVAGDFVNTHFGISVSSNKVTFRDRLIKRTLEHLLLVSLSLSAAIIIALPLGVLAVKLKRTGRIILSIAGIIQTIPSLAILVFMIPLLGIGAEPAMMALFLYSLLPIIRNTYSGIQDIPVSISESAVAIGLTRWEKLRFIELPLAARSILAGIKTASVINVGTATLGALIGAGGYGQPILTGIRLDDLGLILEGAVPAALLALAVQGIFDVLEKWVIPVKSEG
ncbi:MAG: ABC transporter permease subunit [Calditrichaeota bacterium]|nr:ABC transporter permease subunit [Calditrichota bacterium]